MWCRVISTPRHGTRTAYEGDEFRLQPGVGFYLKDDGSWGVADIPDEIVQKARFSGYLTIQGYRCIVFEYNSQHWAQKATGTVAMKISRLARRIAVRWIRSAYSGPDRCPACRGTGFGPGLADCPKCGGMGRIPSGLQFSNIETEDSIMDVDVNGTLEGISLNGTLTTDMDGNYAEWKGIPLDFGPEHPAWDEFVGIMDSDPDIIRAITEYYREEYGGDD